MKQSIHTDCLSKSNPLVEILNKNIPLVAIFVGRKTSTFRKSMFKQQTQLTVQAAWATDCMCFVVVLANETTENKCV